MGYNIRRFLTGVLVLVSLCMLNGVLTLLPAPGIAHADDTGLPDLIIESLNGPSVAPVIGTTITFSATVSNIGNADSTPCPLVFSVGDEVIGSLFIGALESGASADCIFTWKTEGGCHVLTATIDADNSVMESNENNNTMTLAFSVLAADLVFRGITWEPQKASAGDPVMFTITIGNQGSQASRYGEFEFFIDGCSRGIFEIPALEPAASISRTAYWIAQPGTVRVSAELDIWNTTREIYESNNTLETEFTTCGPDLIVDKITWMPLERTDTENITLSIVVKNQGEGSSYGSWLSCYLTGLGWIREQVKPLSANSSTAVSYNWFPGSSNQTVTATIDPDNEILETDEENNTTNIEIPGVGIPDLVLQNLTYSPHQPEVGQPISFTVTVKNTGTRTAYHASLVLRTSYFFNISHRLDSITPGQVIQNTFIVTAKDRILDVRAIVDDLELIDESDETNNSKLLSVTPVVPEPDVDLLITEAYLEPSGPEIGETITITAVVKNTGPAASPEIHLAFYMDDELLSTCPVKSLKSGETSASTFDTTASMGTHLVSVKADFNDYVSEIDEENNDAAIEFTTLAPDLVVKSLIWAPEKPQIGDTVTLVAVIENKGTSTSGETEIEYYVNNIAHGQHYVNQIEPGQTLVRTFIWQAQVIPDSFGAIVDKTDAVIESREYNNSKLAPLPAPDLKVDDITLSPEPAAGANVQFHVQLVNNGGSKAGVGRIVASVDGIPLPVEINHSFLPGESQDITFYWTAELGQHKFSVTVDESDLLVESNESNNIASLLFSIPEALPVSANSTGISSANGTGVLGGSAPSLILPEDDVNADFIPVELFEELQEEEIELPETNESESSPWWSIFSSLWFLVTVSVLGIVAIGVLLFLRRRMTGAGKAEEESEKAPAAEPES